MRLFSLLNLQNVFEFGAHTFWFQICLKYVKKFSVFSIFNLVGCVLFDNNKGT